MQRRHHHGAAWACVSVHSTEGEGYWHGGGWGQHGPVLVYTTLKGRVTGLVWGGLGAAQACVSVHNTEGEGQRLKQVVEEGNGGKGFNDR